jgi:hypothetical protein
MEKFGQEVAAPSELNPATINWADLSAKALEMPSVVTEDTPPPALKASDPLPSIEDVASKVKAQSGETPPTVEAKEEVVATPEPTTTSSPTVREFKDDDLVKIKVDGVEKVVPYKDYKDGIQREAVFTQRMQQLAAQRQQAEQELANWYAQLYAQAQALEAQKQQLTESHPLTKLARQLEAQEKVEQDPNTLATVGEIRKALDAYKQEVAQDLQRLNEEQQAKLVNAAHTIRAQQVQAQDAARFTNALNETLSDKDIAVIKTVVPSPELADAIIRWNVAQMDPQTIEEGIEFAKTFAKQWADNVKAQQKVVDARAEAQKARAVIEPPQGSPPSPVQPPKPQNFFKKDGSGLDWAALHSKALAVMEG